MSGDQNRAKTGGPDGGWNRPAVPAEDTQGEAMHWSNKDLKKDVKPVEPAPGEDTQGESMHWSNKDLKKDVKPLDEPKSKPAPDASDAAEDSEGHSVKFGG